jgi:hypothetical protein
MKNRSKGRLAPFIPVIRSTRSHPAMVALSHGAFRLYVALTAHYSTRLEGAVYLSSRAAMNELGANKTSVLRWYRELEYYGFIRMVSPAYHGLNGNGRAAHYRLTEFRYLNQPATRDFEQWDGTKFQERKRPSHYAGKKQKPRCDSVPTLGTVVGPYSTAAELAKVGPVMGPYGTADGGYSSGSITSLTTPYVSEPPIAVDATVKGHVAAAVVPIASEPVPVPKPDDAVHDAAAALLAADSNAMPDFLRRGHRDCWVKDSA